MLSIFSKIANKERCLWNSSIPPNSNNTGFWVFILCPVLGTFGYEKLLTVLFPPALSTVGDPLIAWASSSPIIKLLEFFSDCPLSSRLISDSGSCGSCTDTGTCAGTNSPLDFTPTLSFIFSSLSFGWVKMVSVALNTSFVASISLWISTLFLIFLSREYVFIVFSKMSNLFFVSEISFITRLFSIGWTIRTINNSLKTLPKKSFNLSASDSSKSSPSYSSMTIFIFPGPSSLVISSMIWLNFCPFLLSIGVTFSWLVFTILFSNSLLGS